MEFEVVCVTKDASAAYDDCRGISKIGYKINSNTKVRTPSQMYDRIEHRGYDFFVIHEGDKTYLEAVKMDDGTKYVRTEANDTSEDNLLKLDSC
jgi:hypothetical protein